MGLKDLNRDGLKNGFVLGSFFVSLWRSFLRFLLIERRLVIFQFGFVLQKFIFPNHLFGCTQGSSVLATWAK
jgi:hypothetical protein